MIDGVALGALTLVVALGFLWRSDAAFAAVWFAVTAATTGFGLVRAELSQLVLSSAGLALLGPGMLGVRVVLRRSVSLGLLSQDQASTLAQARIRKRTEELVRFRLAVSGPSGLVLTPRGRALAALMRVLYRVLGHGS